jgi:hypothetical protein
MKEMYVCMYVCTLSVSMNKPLEFVWFCYLKCYLCYPDRKS